MTSITVAVCTFRPNADLLARVLRILASEAGKIGDVELLLIDNNNNPPISVALPDVRVVREGRPGLTAAREAAARAAGGDVIVFVDDDNLLSRGYLATVREIFDRKPDLALLGAAVLPEYEVTPPRWFKPFEPWLAVRPYPVDHWCETADPLYSEALPVGAGMAVRRAVVLGYFDDVARTGRRVEGRNGDKLSSGEDIDLALYLLTEGHRVAVSGQLRLIHVIPRERISRTYLRRLAVANVQSAAILERKWSCRVGQPIFTHLDIARSRLWIRIVLACMIQLVSPRWWIRLAAYRELLRVSDR